MAPKDSGGKRKGAAKASPLTVYKRGLAAIKAWSPLTSTQSDLEALTALAACAAELQARMGLPTLDAPSAAAAAAGSNNGESAMTNAPTALTDSKADVAVNANGGSVDCVDLLAAVWPALDALEGGMRYGPVVRHNLDLDLEDWEDEPGFLLASCHLELGKLLGRMWPRQEARELRHLGAARQLFPDFVAGAVALAQALLFRADSQDDLQRAERLLKGALRVAQRLAAAGEGDGEADASGSGQDGDKPMTEAAETWADGEAGAAAAGAGQGALSLLLEANAACRREWQAGEAARRSLAMLMCQEGRDGDAAPHLAALEYSHRLARPVLHYPLDPLLSSASSSTELSSSEPTAAATAASDPSTSGRCCPSPAPSPAPTGGYERYCRAVDSALPLPLLEVLRTALSPGSRFWQEHGYGRVGYFSYMHELTSPALSAIHQAATLLHRLILPRFPGVAEARYAEWWAHCRQHPSGHQLHFDSDDEGVGGVRNPIVSGVIYLTGCIGGPTLVTPQLLGGPLAPHGWLIHPRENRLGMFDSSFLHGVIPGRGPSPCPGQFRITLMIAFWRDIQCRPRTDGLPGPSQPFPAPGSPAASRCSWMADLPPHPDGPDGWGTTDSRDAAPTAIDRVWERLDGTAAQPGAVQYDACFQGF